MSFSPLQNFDNSFKLLLLSNLATIILALVFDWSLITLLWGYWLQSVIIGVFAFLKIIILGLHAENEKSTVIGKGIVFVFSYGILHFAYIILLRAFTSTSLYFAHLEMPVDIAGVLIMGIIFFANHCFSFIYHLQASKKKQFTPRDLAQTMLEPYKRALPMLFTLTFGAVFIMYGMGNKIVILFFQLLKTAADLLGHYIKHRT